MTEQQALSVTRQTAGAGSAPGRSDAAARLGALATLVVAALLVVLTWANTLRAVRGERQAAEAHALATVSAGATMAAAGFDHRLREADALLSLMAEQWRSDPAGFRLETPPAAMLRRPGGARLYLLGADGIVRHATEPAAVGHGLGGALREAFGRALRDPSGAAALVPRIEAAGATGRARDATTPRMVFAVPLIAQAAAPTGASPAAAASFGGFLVLTVPLRGLLAPLVARTLAPHSALLLVGTRDWRVHAGSGRLDTALPDNLMGSAIAAARAGADGTASGLARLRPGAPRVLFAIHGVPDQPLAVVVARTRAAALRAIAAASVGTWRFAIAISALIALATLVVLGEIGAMARRERRVARDRATMAAANEALARAKRDADAKAAHLEGLLAGLPDGIIMFDAALNLVAWNAQVAGLAGIPPSLLRARTNVETMLRAQAEAGEFGRVDIAAEVAHRLEAYRTGAALGRTERARPDGRFIEVRREPLPDGGSVGLFTDITERKRAEQALREARATAEAATVAKSRFVAMVSHEIRTPLQALMNGIGLLEDAPLDPMFGRLLGGMRQAGVSLLRLLSDILDVSRMEAGRLALRPERIDPRRPLEQAIGMLAPLAGERGLRLVLDVAPDVPGRILADPERLCQVVVNLLSNAVKFSGPGTVRMTVERVAGPALRLAVRDPGPAIDPRQQDKLFQPFTRLTEGGVAEAGVGLGLSICRDLVALMGGEIGYRPDAETGGNAFWFTVPLAHGVERAARPADPAERARARIGLRPRRLRVLLAEDVSVSRFVTATMLRREGHAVTPVADGAAAVAAAAHGDFDLILMDLQLPVLDGFAASRRIRGLTGAAGRVPIVALSGHVGTEERRACRAAGMRELLAKPAGRETLLSALVRHGGLGAPGAESVSAAADPAAADPAAADPAAAGGLAPARLAELRETLAPDMLARVTEECLDELATRLARLREAAAVADATAAGAAAHAMAGLAGGYGLAGFERTVRTAMAAIRAGQWTDPVLRANLLEAELATAAASLRRAVGVGVV